MSDLMLATSCTNRSPSMLCSCVHAQSRTLRSSGCIVDLRSSIQTTLVRVWKRFCDDLFTGALSPAEFLAIPELVLIRSLHVMG